MLPETPSQTVGPYLSLGLPWEAGPVADPDGVRIEGLVLDRAGEPVLDALVETWQRDPPTFARGPTDDEGRWHVVVPLAPYLAVHVFARGLLRHLTTRVYLEPGGGGSRPRAGPARAPRDPDCQRDDDGYRFDICIQGEGETVFFDV
ncbi:MAG: protocatechuate 3,4-dioxygenase subunit alpha [Solirubrobacteraceae bacterium]